MISLAVRRTLEFWGLLQAPDSGRDWTSAFLRLQAIRVISCNCYVLIVAIRPVYDAAYSSCQACQLCRSGPACSANVEFKLDVTDRPRSDGGGTYVKANPVYSTFHSYNNLISAPVSHRKKRQSQISQQQLPKASLLQRRQHVQVYGRQGKGEGSRQWDVSCSCSPPLTGSPQTRQ